MSITYYAFTLLNTFLDFAASIIHPLGLIMLPAQKGEENKTHHVFLKLQSPLCPFLIFFHTAVQIRKFRCSFLHQ